jgi:hypothetical protein
MDAFNEEVCEEPVGCVSQLRAREVWLTRVSFADRVHYGRREPSDIHSIAGCQYVRDYRATENYNVSILSLSSIARSSGLGTIDTQSSGYENHGLERVSHHPRSGLGPDLAIDRVKKCSLEAENSVQATTIDTHVRMSLGIDVNSTRPHPVQTTPVRYERHERARWKDEKKKKRLKSGTDQKRKGECHCAMECWFDS